MDPASLQARVDPLLKAGSARMDPSLRAHSEAKGEAIQKQHLDCFVALLLAMTRALGQFGRNLAPVPCPSSQTLEQLRSRAKLPLASAAAPVLANVEFRHRSPVSIR